jgi:hypothetical protein
MTAAVRPAGKGRDDWRSEELMAMVRDLQPGILINDRLDILGDGRAYSPYRHAGAVHLPYRHDGLVGRIQAVGAPWRGWLDGHEGSWPSRSVGLCARLSR